MNLGLHGSYFGRNFGDTLILTIVRNWIKEASPNAVIILPFVGSEKEAIEILGMPSPIKDIKKLDGMIFGPGGYFGEPPGTLIERLRWTIRNYKRHIRWNKELYNNNIPYIIIGVGVGPITSKYLRKKIVKLFNNARYITVRDVYSRDYLVKWGVDTTKINVTSDVALTLTPDNINKDINKPKIALHFPSMNLEGAGKLNDFLKFVEYLNKENEVYLLEDQPNQFRSLRKGNLNNLLKANGMFLDVIEYKDPNTLIDKLQGVDYIITSKLHVGIIGYALGKRILSIPKHTKTIRFYEQINRKEFCIPYEKIDLNVLVDRFEALRLIDNSNNLQYENAIKNKNFVFKFIEELDK